jgi:hypothetical protein
MTYERLIEFLGHFKEGKLKRHLRVEDTYPEVVYDYSTNIYQLKGNDVLNHFIAQNNTHFLK